MDTPKVLKCAQKQLIISSGSILFVTFPPPLFTLPMGKFSQEQGRIENNSCLNYHKLQMNNSPSTLWKRELSFESWERELNWVPVVNFPYVSYMILNKSLILSVPGS